MDRINAKGNAVMFDIDDCIVRTDCSDLKIVKTIGNRKFRLTTEEYASDFDKQGDKAYYSFSEFDDVSKMKKSILNGIPIIPNLRILDEYAYSGYDIGFLTARSNEDALYELMKEYMMIRDKDGKLHKIGDRLNRKLCFAVNDSEKKYDGRSTDEKKAIVLKNVCLRYGKVVYIDDDDLNLKAAERMGIGNIEIIKAFK